MAGMVGSPWPPLATDLEPYLVGNLGTHMACIQFIYNHCGAIWSQRFSENGQAISVQA